MSKIRRPKGPRLAPEEIYGNQFTADYLRSEHLGRFSSVIVPLVGESYMKYARDDVDKEFLKYGDRELTKYCQSINGRMTQRLYELFLDDRINHETISDLFPSDNRGDVSRKVMYLHRRYYKDENNLLHDSIHGDRVVFDPIHTFDMIMGCHLLNNHESCKNVHHGLVEFYANVSRDIVDRAIQFCTACNVDKKLQPMIKERKANIFQNLMPLERIEIEVLEPYEGERIEKKYSHVLIVRDLYSKYIWMAPLKNTKFKHLVPSVAKLLLSLPRIPLFVESSSLNWNDMFDIFEKVTERYDLSIGLGTDKRTYFHYIKFLNVLKARFTDNKEQCINDWNMCLVKVSAARNRIYEKSVKNAPSNIINCFKKEDLKGHFKRKRATIIHKLPPENIMKTGRRGMIYIEGGDNLGIVVHSDTEADMEAEGEGSGEGSHHDNNIQAEAPIDSLYETPADENHPLLDYGDSNINESADITEPAAKRAKLDDSMDLSEPPSPSSTLVGQPTQQKSLFEVSSEL